jgi:hypothetical protein
VTKPLTGYELEIAILHAEARLDAELIEEFKGEAYEYKQAIDRVRMLHVPNLRDGQEYCGTCVYPSIWDEWQVWPCKTIQALDGEA